MNLLEHYIEEIHEVKEAKKEWGNVIMADVTVNCYGKVERKTTGFSSWDEWEKVQERGHYLA